MRHTATVAALATLIASGAQAATVFVGRIVSEETLFTFYDGSGATTYQSDTFTKGARGAAWSARYDDSGMVATMFDASFFSPDATLIADQGGAEIVASDSSFGSGGWDSLEADMYRWNGEPLGGTLVYGRGYDSGGDGGYSRYVYYTLGPASGAASGAFSAVPEPAGWATMLLGFSMLGAMVRRRRAVA